MAKKILFINQEMTPYVPETELAEMGRDLPQRMQESGNEIRTFMPKWGNINERRGQLHEVIRLSGMNLVINDVDMPLIVKVASIQKERMQVYFIDNDEYFKQEDAFDDQGKLYADNDERCIFFAKGIMETVKKLNWSPDLIHIQGWLGALLPLYLRTYYKDEPIFYNTKTITCFLRSPFEGQLDAALLSKVGFDEITEKEAEELKEPHSLNLIKIASRYSDAITTVKGTLPQEAIDYIQGTGKPSLQGETIEATCKVYPQFYKELMHK